MLLVAPSLDHAEEFTRTFAELQRTGDTGFWDELGPPESMEEYIRLRIDHAEGRRLPTGWIPASTFFLMEENKLIGEVTIRHELTEHLRNVGGHIGYWIRPSKRGRGYGKKILALSLAKARLLGIDDVLVTCDETNIGSRKIIEANGGVLERVQEMGPDLPRKLLFWIRNSL